MEKYLNPTILGQIFKLCSPFSLTSPLERFPYQGQAEL